MYAQVGQAGSVSIWQRQPDLDPVLGAVCAICAAADDINAYLKTRECRRGTSGVWEIYNTGRKIELEAFGTNEAELQKAIAAYLRVYPWEEWRTSFEREPRCIAGEWTAVGDRNAIEGWAL